MIISPAILSGKIVKYYYCLYSWNQNDYMKNDHYAVGQICQTRDVT